jgi:2-methylcitrate dehydratase
MRTVIERLAELASGLTYAQLPDAVVHEAKRRLLDSLGVMLAGTSGETVVATREAMLALGGRQATLVGDPRRTSVERATLVNCTALRYLDYMDGHAGPYPCHVCANIPAVLCMAEWTGACGQDVVRGMVLGYEVQIRLQLAVGDPDITSHGWAGPSNLGLSVPAAIGGLLGLSAQQLGHAMAISLTHASALDAVSRGQLPGSKSCLDGMIAMSAVTAALLAKKGITGPLGAFEGAGGYVEAVARRYDKEILLAPLERFRILDVYDKRYNAGKYGQTAVAAGLELLESLPNGWRDVERLTLKLAERDYRQQLDHEAERRRPQTRDTANHSVVYCLAAALVDGDLLPEQFEPARLRDPDILSLVDRISLATDPELSAHWPSANPAEVDVVTSAGDVRRARVVYPPGHPKNRLTDEQLEAKFRGLAGRVLPAESLEGIVELLWRLDQLAGIGPLMKLVAHTPPSAPECPPARRAAS